MTDKSDGRRPIKRALLSVSDKNGLIDFARALAARGVALISTGGTAKTLSEAGLDVADVASVTGFPEMLDGRVKTLHPAIHGGILARRDMEAHLDAIKTHNIAPIDLVVVNLYPFAQTRARGGDFDECLENIDIGGPALIRAAAKNHDGVAVVTDPSDYAAVLAEMNAHDGATTHALRRKLAGLAFARTGAYDAEVSAWFAELEGEKFPPVVAVAGTLKEKLRYGENPHQAAAFYLNSAKRPGIATAMQLQGKELSFNNLNDTDAAYECVAEFDAPAVAIIKHANPCGVATGTDLRDAFLKALATDPVSAFGGIVAVNRPLDAAVVEAIGKLFLEVIIAPEVTEEAKALLAKKQNLRLLSAGALPDAKAPGMTLRSLAGGYLLQTRDDGRIGESDLKTVTKRAPTDAERRDMLFAFRVAKHVKSNAIVYVKNGATVGIGAGQMSRVDSSRIAAHKAEESGKVAGLKESPAIGSVVASDAFFPFADGLEAAIAAGATAVIQPGGSVRDNEVIAAADKAGIAMVFTGMRHFRH
ncbi:MAG TPA: bifunctional phosphoribosylaminoimidazolecarboxamide formyltransferase/IMP cyclohydrolase [Stellaceae bacterium]|jgi:phosphoribosylaminoimidazolecarboxamide formyltransferase/IMP cyclohydrolase|nr:bifunctional phosphoribosylaminoimidazolecarboxamide formyltransferase/IMP cyclohydrolase [Stellaceae bacterium]